MINERFLKFEMLALGFFFNSFEKLCVVKHIIDIIVCTYSTFIANPYFTVDD